MIYYPDRQIDTDQPSCLSLGATGRFIAIIEIVFFTFVFYTVKDYFADDFESLLIITTLLGLLSIFSLSLFAGVMYRSQIFITPWMWMKYAIIFLELIRFFSSIVEIAFSDKNTASGWPVFELLFLGYNVFALSIIRELVDEIEDMSIISTFKHFQYVRV